MSCIIPVYNAAPFLAETLQSVFAQTHRNLEIIAVDDGSVDESPAVLAAYGARLRAIRQSNQGEAAARNTGVRAARGEFLAFLDADDLWEPPKLSRQLARLREAPDIDLSFTAFQNFWTAEMGEEARHVGAHPVSRPSVAWSVGTLLARPEAFVRFGPFDETLRSLPNMTWFVQAARRGARIDVLPEVLMRRRLHSGNATRAHGGMKADEFLPMLKAWRDFRRGPPR